MTRIEKVLRTICFEQDEFGEWRMTVNISGEEITYQVEEINNDWGWPSVVVVEVGGDMSEAMDLASFVIMLDTEVEQAVKAKPFGAFYVKFLHEIPKKIFQKGIDFF